MPVRTSSLDVISELLFGAKVEPPRTELLLPSHLLQAHIMVMVTLKFTWTRLEQPIGSLCQHE